jgi:hypothetical protein
MDVESALCMHVMRGWVLDTDFEVEAEADPEKSVVVVLRIGKDVGSGYAGRCVLHHIEVSIQSVHYIQRRSSRRVGKKDERTDARMNGS